MNHPSYFEAPTLGSLIGLGVFLLICSPALFALAVFMLVFMACKKLFSPR